MKNFILTILLLLTTIGCNSSKTDNTQNIKDNKIKIVTTLFPTYDFSKEIGKDKVSVKLLLPPGIEAHSYDPTPRDIAEINSADIFIYTGDSMEPWVKKLLESLNNKQLKVVDVSTGIELKDFGIKDEDEDDHDDGGHSKDPHIWTDPVLAQTIVDTISKSIIEKDTINKDFYKENEQAYLKKLNYLDSQFKLLAGNSKKKDIISGGHFVFGYLFERYGFVYHSAYEGFSPNAEPTPKQMQALEENIKKTNIKYVYYEELIDPKLSKLLSEELDLKMLLLHGAHNVSKEELDKNITYYEIMLKNIDNLKLGLDYSE